MADSERAHRRSGYPVREVVGVFSSHEAVESAFHQLEAAGFNRAAVSVLVNDKNVMEQIGKIYDNAIEMQDAAKVPQTAYVSQVSRKEGMAATVGIPLYIGGCAGAFAVVASGGALAAIIGATIAGGAAGAGLGALLARAIGQRYAQNISEQVEHGGIVLWVHVRGEKEEKNGIDVLTSAGAVDVHAHEIEHESWEEDVPFSQLQPDPFLSRGP